MGAKPRPHRLAPTTPSRRLPGRAAGDRALAPDGGGARGRPRRADLPLPSRRSLGALPTPRGPDRRHGPRPQGPQPTGDHRPPRHPAPPGHQPPPRHPRHLRRKNRPGSRRNRPAPRRRPRRQRSARAAPREHAFPHRAAQPLPTPPGNGGIEGGTTTGAQAHPLRGRAALARTHPQSPPPRARDQRAPRPVGSGRVVAGRQPRRRIRQLRIPLIAQFVRARPLQRPGVAGDRLPGDQITWRELVDQPEAVVAAISRALALR